MRLPVTLPAIPMVEASATAVVKWVVQAGSKVDPSSSTSSATSMGAHPTPSPRQPSPTGLRVPMLHLRLGVLPRDHRCVLSQFHLRVAKQSADT